MKRHSFQSCTAEFDGRTLRVGNEHVERRWRVEGGLLYAESFFDKAAAQEWITRPSAVPSPYPPAVLQGPFTIDNVDLRDGVDRPMEARALLVVITVTSGPATLTYKLKLFPAARGFAIQLTTSGLPLAPQVDQPPPPSPTGIEDSFRSTPPGPIPDTIDCFDVDPRHVTLTQVTLQDRTDVHDNLVFETQWLLSPAEPVIRAAGNVFILEHRLTGRGLIVVKFAPLPHARPVPSPDDLRVLGSTVHVVGGTGHPSAVLSYAGGRAGRIATLQQFQRQMRVPDPLRDARLVSNTWGDRSKDGRISQSFMMRELVAAEALGIDVVQLDDGWQRGVSGNSVTPGGTWTGFWARDERFWDPHPTRFPDGLAPLAREAAGRGLKLGLWFAPDSSDDFANWRRDADAVLTLHRAHGIDHFKIDGVKMYTTTGEANLDRFVDAVLGESDGRIVFDLDVTAAVRPGYLGLVRAGNVFVENRYTDWARYYPHATLRNFWQLAQYIDPVRLRMEFLNHARNAHRYEDDPLAPAHYDADYLFAAVMFGSPLAWFEVSNLPSDYVERAAPLIATWKRHRARVHGGTIIPIGAAPDGLGWTGFASHDGSSSGYLLFFRELNDLHEMTFDVPMFPAASYAITPLGGGGDAFVTRGLALVRIPQPLGFLWVRVTPKHSSEIPKTA